MRILFVHNKLTRFVRIDRDLLAVRHCVTERHETSVRNLRPNQIWREVEKHDLVFCWFASWHDYFPVMFARLLGKPSVVVVGGYDLACVPEAHYGSQRGGLRRLVSRAIIRSATILLPPSEAAKTEAIIHGGANPQRTSVLSLGVEHLTCVQAVRRQPLIVTVGNVWAENLVRKGLLPFVQAAAHLPDLQFIHAGKWCDDSINILRREAGPNVQFLGMLSDADLAALYARASVYVQASAHEAFGLSLAEAMLAGCIPVVTRAGSLPEVVGDTGLYIPTQTPRDVAMTIRAALNQPPYARERAQARVQALFSLERRAAGLHSVVESLARAKAA